MFGPLVSNAILNSSEHLQLHKLEIQQSNNQITLYNSWQDNFNSHNPLHLSKLSYYSQSKVAIHLSRKLTLQLIIQKVFHKVIMRLGYEKVLVFLGTQNAQVVSQIIDTTRISFENFSFDCEFLLWISFWLAILSNFPCSSYKRSSRNSYIFFIFRNINGHTDTTTFSCSHSSPLW